MFSERECKAAIDGKSELKKAENRLSEIERIIVKLYEEKVCGRMPEERFELLAKNYETEQAELKQKRRH